MRFLVPGTEQAVSVWKKIKANKARKQFGENGYLITAHGFLPCGASIVVFLCILASCSNCFASKEQSVKIGNSFYEKGSYDESIEKYREALKEDPDSDIINFNIGTALYKKKDFGSAVTHFRKALLSEDKHLESDAHYNLGNSLYKWGIEQEDTNINAAVQSLEEALSHYEATMAARPKDEDARFNHEFVKKELERLKEKQQQQQQPKTCPLNKDQQKQQKDKQEQSQDQRSQQQQAQKQDGQQPQKKQESGEQQESQASSRVPQQGEDDQSQVSQSERQADEKDLTKKEAQMLLENYQQTEEPKGLLQLRTQKGRQHVVERDW